MEGTVTLFLCLLFLLELSIRLFAVLLLGNLSDNSVSESVTLVIM